MTPEELQRILRAEMLYQRNRGEDPPFFVMVVVFAVFIIIMLFLSESQ